MFGSLMMFASGVLASSPSSASASARCVSGPELGEDAPGERDVAQLDVDARLPGERLDDRQERVRRQRRRLVRVGVDELHAAPHGIRVRYGLRPARPPSAQGQGPRRRPLRRAARRRRHGRAPPASRARTSRASSGARSASRRTRTCSPAGWSAPPRCCATTDRSVADICFSVGLQSVGSFTTSFTRMFGVSPTAYRAQFPPAPTYARVPACVVRAYAPSATGSTFREDSAAARD